jgi:D-serine dehydratase
MVHADRMLGIAELEGSLVSGLVKGVPNGIPALAIQDIGKQGWNALREDLPLPVAVLKFSALERNERWMKTVLSYARAQIAPHGKTSMSPQLLARQMERGAWGITVANTHQLEVCRRFGFSQIVIANQLVGKQALRYVFDELERDGGLELFALVDDVTNVWQLIDAAKGRALKKPLNLLVEIGYPGGRAGCRDERQAWDVARAVNAGEPALLLRGVECFEGLIAETSDEASESKVRALLDRATAFLERCSSEQLFSALPIVFSAGGSAYYDLVADHFKRSNPGADVILLLRSGCCLTSDSGMYARAVDRILKRNTELASQSERPAAALELWAYVQSRPEPRKVMVSLGRRDTSFEDGGPTPEAWHRSGTDVKPLPLSDDYVITSANDQHTHLQVPQTSPLRVGDMIGFGISHPCLTFDKWELLYVVDDSYNVTSAIRTFF